MSDRIKCPTCNGEKKSFGFVNGGEDISTHSAGWVDCFTCKGIGQIADAHYWRIIEGRVQRQIRLDCGLTMSEAAQQRGITVAQLSAIESGRMESTNDR